MRTVIEWLSDCFSRITGWFTDRAIQAHLLEEEPENEELAAYVRKKNSSRVMIFRAALIAAAILIAVLIVKHISDNRSYRDYEVITGTDKADNVSSYTEMGKNILRYSSDGAALADSRMESIWDISFSMTNPESYVAGTTAAIYDKLGTAVYVFDEKGQVGSFDTGEPIAKARVSEQGNVAVLLQYGENQTIRYYTSGGSEIATISTSMTDYGSPIELALSSDGMQMAVSYLAVSEGGIVSNVVCYDFSSARSTDGKITGEMKYEGVIVPALIWKNNSDLIAIRDDGFSILNAGSSLKEETSVSFDTEISSVFYDESNIGFVYRSSEEGHKFEMTIYNSRGKVVSSAGVDLNYDKVRLSGGQILFSNASELAVYTIKGVCRGSVTVSDGNIADVLKIEANRYLLMTDQRTELVRLV
ncbi:MAG: DUF5711 family protein [Lachnospiraceae bacterium]|nr:DUF5711 family protein [Lachnospiraceae bacterium]